VALISTLLIYAIAIGLGVYSLLRVGKQTASVIIQLIIVV